ncbi:MAG: DUF1553 domain-containing protein [Verrucomicrobiaceae bacterium]|nr:DUF1553 domain-containing protein [Verrucomicrobiaceae bacterium]
MSQLDIRISLLLPLLLLALPRTVTAEEKIRFNRDVRPILSENCFACHGQDAKKRKAKLRLDKSEAAIAERDDIRAIAPGNLEKSEAWLRIISEDKDEVMPPEDSHKELSGAQKDVLRQWILQGAQYEDHWAFIAPVAKALPDAGRGIDHFIDAKLKELGLTSTAEASHNALIRRVAYAVTGLPPTPEELAQFLADQKPGAYERMVDRYLASRHYGEEMARHWLDVARYADTHGMHLDNERQMFAYRDWVVDAFNRNLPFDQFTIEQIAGDLIPDASVDQLVATGFNRCNITTGEGGTIAAEFIFRYAVERASTTAQTWLGLTAGCAVCHDHKFDPIPTKDFYSFYAFFHSNADPALDGNKLLTAPVVKVTPSDDDAKTVEFNKRAAELDVQIAGIEKRIAAAASRIKYVDPAALTPPPEPEVKEVIWFEDGFPKGTIEVTGPPLKLVTREEGPVFRGKLAIRRTAKNAIGQDVYSQGKFTVPRDGTFFAHCYLDPKDPPEAIMLQFFVGGWNHRVVWGAHEKIGWGKVNTHQRVDMGSLPEKGKWVRLEFAADKVGLKPGTTVTGYALTQFSGTMGWDHFGISSTTDPAKDPAYSWQAWKAQPEATRNQDLSPDLQKRFKGKAPDKWNTKEETELRNQWLGRVCLGARKELEPLTSEKAGIGTQRAALAQERAAYESSMHSTFIWRDLQKPRDSFVMLRGAYNKPGEKVEPDTPAVLPPLEKANPDGRATRLDLAKWMVSRENPLTARVAVNRFWQQLFGVGLVKTGHDFGTQGDLPTHPKLLDWLAVRFQDESWDMKKLMRLMLVSDAFRRTSSGSADLWQADAENRYLARGPRIRLDAEQLRDAALLAGGLLVKKMGGKGVRTYQPPNIWEPVGFRGSNTAKYKRDNGDALYRRSIYTFLKRTAPAPFMANFDAPNREASCYRRDRSNTPLQALQLLNDVQFFEAARGLATRMMVTSKDPAGRVNYAYQVVLSRAAAADELELIGDYYQKQVAKYKAAPAEAAKAITFGDSKPPDGVDAPELAAWTLVANLILNLDENIIRN